MVNDIFQAIRRDGAGALEVLMATPDLNIKNEDGQPGWQRKQN